MPAHPTNGSTTKVRRTQYSIKDPASQKTLLIFDTVDNDAFIEQKQYARCQFYLSPLGFFDVARSALGEALLIDGNVYQYRFRMWQYRDYLFDRAAAVLTEQYAGMPGAPRFTRANVTKLGVQHIAFKAGPYYPWIEIKAHGGGTGALPLDDTVNVYIYVPATRKAEFEKLVTGNGLPVTMLFSYNVLDVSMETVQWTQEDLRNTTSYQALVSGGGRFVTARQLREMIVEAARKSNVYIYRDPGMEGKLFTALQGFVPRVLDEFAAMTTHHTLANIDEAKEVDAILRKGTGFTAQQFKPLVLLWNMIEEIKSETGHEAANHRLQKYVESNQDSFDFSLGALFEGITAAFGFGSDSSSVRDGFFDSEERFRDFRSRYVRGEGQEARVTAMGVDLLERGTFESRLNSAVGATLVEVAPAGEVTPVETELVVRSTDGAEVAPEPPIGTILASAGNLDAVPGWLPCDGRALSRLDYPALFEVLGTRYGAGIENGVKQPEREFNLPDLRGRVIIGAGPGSGLTAHALGEQGGAESHRLTVPQLPGHTHALHDPGHTHAQVVSANFNHGGSAVRTDYNGDGVGAVPYSQGVTTEASPTSITVQASGGDEAHPSMPPFVALNYFIRAARHA